MSQKKPKSFYSNALDKAERVELKTASVLEGIDEEIALLRLHIKQQAKLRPVDTDQLTRCFNSLCRMLVTRYTLEGKGKKAFKEAMMNVLRDIALPLGVKVAETFITKQISG